MYFYRGMTLHFRGELYALRHPAFSLEWTDYVPLVKLLDIFGHPYELNGEELTIFTAPERRNVSAAILDVVRAKGETPASSTNASIRMPEEGPQSGLRLRIVSGSQSAFAVPSTLWAVRGHIYIPLADLMRFLPVTASYNHRDDVLVLFYRES